MVSVCVTFKCATKFDVWSSRAWIKFCRPIRWQVIQLALINLIDRISIRLRTSKNPYSNSGVTRIDGISKLSSLLWQSKMTMKQKQKIQNICLDSRKVALSFIFYRLQVVSVVVALHSVWQPKIPRILWHALAKLNQKSWKVEKTQSFKVSHSIPAIYLQMNVIIGCGFSLTISLMAELLANETLSYIAVVIARY